MTTDNKINELAQILIDAFDIDIQLFQNRLLQNIVNTQMGNRLSSWSRSNPQMFDMLLRFASVAIQRLPKDKNLPTSFIVYQMKRFPFDLRRAVFGDLLHLDVEGFSQPKYLFSTQSDQEFNSRYEEAIKDLSEDDLMLITGLNKRELIRWVNSPERIRSILIKKWRNKNEMINSILLDINKKTKDLRKKTKDLRKKTENSLKRRKEWKKEGFTGSIEKRAIYLEKSFRSTFDSGILCRVLTPTIEILSASTGKTSIPTSKIKGITIEVEYGIFGKRKGINVLIYTIDIGNFKGKLLTEQLLIVYGEDNQYKLDLYNIRSIIAVVE